MSFATLAAVENERNKLDTLFLHMTDGVVAFDHDSLLIHCNPAATNMLHRSVPEGTTYDTLFGQVYPFQETLASKDPTTPRRRWRWGPDAGAVSGAVFRPGQRRRAGGAS
ncbi:PAS domain-containing protein [Oscillibacter sp.]|uniref:PAS domain-containing protein n=1 Tax=Oscillibacter sp. TaxID=1945593 RepID=UPI002580CB81|nr:PAS domain-containing protein [Oscillibacter sp.]